MRRDTLPCTCRSRSCPLCWSNCASRGKAARKLLLQHPCPLTLAWTQLPLTSQTCIPAPQTGLCLHLCYCKHVSAFLSVKQISKCHGPFSWGGRTVKILRNVTVQSRCQRRPSLLESEHAILTLLLSCELACMCCVSSCSLHSLFAQPTVFPTCIFPDTAHFLSTCIAEGRGVYTIAGSAVAVVPAMQHLPCNTCHAAARKAWRHSNDAELSALEDANSLFSQFHLEVRHRVECVELGCCFRLGCIWAKVKSNSTKSETNMEYQFCGKVGGVGGGRVLWLKLGSRAQCAHACTLLTLLSVEGQAHCAHACNRSPCFQLEAELSVLAQHADHAHLTASVARAHMDVARGLGLSPAPSPLSYLPPPAAETPSAVTRPPSPALTSLNQDTGYRVLRGQGSRGSVHSDSGISDAHELQEPGSRGSPAPHGHPPATMHQELTGGPPIGMLPRWWEELGGDGSSGSSPTAALGDDWRQHGPGPATPDSMQLTHAAVFSETSGGWAAESAPLASAAGRLQGGNMAVTNNSPHWNGQWLGLGQGVGQPPAHRWSNDIGGDQGGRQPAAQGELPSSSPPPAGPQQARRTHRVADASRKLPHPQHGQHPQQHTQEGPWPGEVWPSHASSPSPQAALPHSAGAPAPGHAAAGGGFGEVMAAALRHPEPGRSLNLAGVLEPGGHMEWYSDAGQEQGPSVNSEHPGSPIRQHDAGHSRWQGAAGGRHSPGGWQQGPHGSHGGERRQPQGGAGGTGEGTRAVDHGSLDGLQAEFLKATTQVRDGVIVSNRVRAWVKVRVRRKDSTGERWGED